MQRRLLPFASVAWLGVWALGLSAVACKKSGPTGSTGGAAPSGSSFVLPAPIASVILASPREISAVVNPKSEPPYTGPQGKVAGRVRISGDAPPDMPEALAGIKDECAPAREVYGKLFREGPDRSLADVLVAVTGYSGYIPETSPVLKVPASGCAWSTRTIALTFGQRLDIEAKDRRAYIPDLVGARMPAQLVALPGGSGSSLYPQAPGRYVLVDSLRIFSRAEVLVLKYSTHAVTGLDGRYTIAGVPAGKVTLSAFLPATGETVEHTIQVPAGGTLEQDLEFKFDRHKFEEDLARTKQAQPAPSAKPPSTSP